MPHGHVFFLLPTYYKKGKIKWQKVARGIGYILYDRLRLIKKWFAGYSCLAALKKEVSSATVFICFAIQYFLRYCSPHAVFWCISPQPDPSPSLLIPPCEITPLASFVFVKQQNLFYRAVIILQPFRIFPSENSRWKL